MRFGWRAVAVTAIYLIGGLALWAGAAALVGRLLSAP